MSTYEDRRVFRELTKALDEELDQKREADAMRAYASESRPLPPEFVREGIAVGHIALQNGFDD